MFRGGAYHEWEVPRPVRSVRPVLDVMWAALIPADVLLQLACVREGGACAGVGVVTGVEDRTSCPRSVQGGA